MATLQKFIDLNLSIAASSLRGWRGTAAFRPARKQPEKMLVLYDIENCPYCRLVRETLTELDLDVLILPCPRGGERYRQQAIENGGKAQFPLLHDPNVGSWMYESADIIDYLKTQYGRAERAKLPHSLQVLSSDLASGSRLLAGMRQQASNKPAKPLELYSFESSPYSRPVREKLCELELPYILRNTGKAAWKDMGPPQVRAKFFPDAPVTGRNRKALLERTGKVQVPYLIDPNTGQEMYESADILAYLQSQYASA